MYEVKTSSDLTKFRNGIRSFVEEEDPGRTQEEVNQIVNKYVIQAKITNPHFSVYLR